MGKKDRFKQVFKSFGHPTKASSSKSASNASGAVLHLEPQLNESTNRTNKAPSTENRPQNAPVRDLWGLALEKISSKDKDVMSGIVMSGSKLDILQRLRIAAMDKQTKCESKRWKFELNGRQIVLRDVAEKIMVWIDKFKQIGDIVVNFDPVHAALPWAGVRFLLEMSLAESQQMGALLTGVERMMYLIGRCQTYEALYLNMEQPEQEEWVPAVTNLTSALVALYASMLGFLASAIRAYDQSIISRTLHAALNPAEVIDFLGKCQTLENSTEIEANNCERMYNRQLQAGSEEQIAKLKNFLEDLQTPILRTDSRVAALCERLDSSERLSILQWISGIPYRENHDFACKGRTSKTGEWLLQHEKYREWRASSASTILWLHGDPGAGKTKLISTVVDDLLTTFEKLPNDEAFAYFYCDRNQSDRREPALILSSFVRQLSTPRTNDAIAFPTVRIYNQKRQSAFASTKLELKESQKVLADLFQIYPQINLVVDALDECDKETRSGFIDILDELVTDSPKPIKILISSRRDRDIRHRFKEGPNLEIRAVDNRDDIKLFVNHQIFSIEKSWQDGISSELRKLICETLVEKSGGMFQWVALQIAVLRELDRERDIRNRLGKLPQTLKTAYDELYHKIQSQGESTPIIADRAFQWVMCSCWPLSPAELVAAVCQDPDTDEIDEVDIKIDAVLNACQNLLVVDQELNVCRFSHLSVQEYFETHHWSPRETDCSVAKVCLSLLINRSATPEQNAKSTKEVSDNSARDVFEYACLNWATHVQRLEDNSILEDRLAVLLKQFLGSMDLSSLAYQNWHKMMRAYYDSYRYGETRNYYALPLSRISGQLSPCSQASLAIVAFGFHDIILDWWTVGFADLDQRNSSGESLLLLAATSGSISTVEDLLRRGADVNSLSESHGSALQAASGEGHESVVRLLLDKGADVNAANGKALHKASLNGHESVVVLLIDKGAKVNFPDEWSRPLDLASFSGHEPVVRLLLDKGADVSYSGGQWGSALNAASWGDHKSIVQLLLDNGANVNASGGSALQAASASGHESVVQLLLDNGANVNGSGGEPLQMASASGHKSVMQLLLDNGANVNGSGGESLQAASASGHKSVMQLLLDKGADVNASGGRYGSALQAASFLGSEWAVDLLLDRADCVDTSQEVSSSGHESVVQLLLDNGADVNASGGEYGSALQAASFRGSELVVQLLLDNGANVNASGGEYGSALQAASSSSREWLVKQLLDSGADVQAASCRGSESVVQLLLDNGANVNASGGKYGSALQAASSSGHKSVMQLLLDKGADVNTSGGEYGSALQAASLLGSEWAVLLLLDKSEYINSSRYVNTSQAASSSGHESVVQLLLDKGADVNASGGEYGSALQAASFRGSKLAVQLLIDNGANVNASGGEYGSALQAASSSSHESVVKRPLYKGADVQAASFLGSESVVQMLLDKGVDVNASGGKYGSALQAASSTGHKSKVQLLLDKGADVNASGGFFGSALQAASCFGHESIVQMLLDKGADVIASGGKYGSALQAASASGHESVVQLLLEKGADVNASGGEYGGALQAASFLGSEWVVQLLLDNGANVNASGGEYGSALQAASSSGHESVVQLLLKNGAEENTSGEEIGSAMNVVATSHGHKARV